MKTLNLKPTHKAVKTYYNELQQLSLLDADKEGAVAPAFANLLRHCARQFNWTLYEKYPLKHGTRNIYPDGALVDTFNLPYGYWEAKDTQDDLEQEIRKKFEKGYPKDNILFQAPNRAILYQDGRQRLDCNITQPDALVDILKVFFEYQPPQYEEWQQAVDAFKEEVPKLGQGILTLIEQERQTNKQFVKAFDKFAELCREAINPNISIQAIEEMLIQHLLTERIFRKVFNNPDFVNLNIVASEIEKVIRALVFPHGGRFEFFKPLNRFYFAIESTATTISDFSQKQAFLNTVYEKFFQGFSVKIADTHGIVYTPQLIVKFMVNSIEEILHTEFNRSLSDEGVHILDPFVGTGNFIIHVMQKIRKTALPYKYKEELHCNEVMLLPYYIASMNIEHEYMILTGDYKPFEGICLVDTFQLAEPAQQIRMSFMTEENTERVEQQKKAPIFVILGNPPYNIGQVNENDNNKNRKYETMDQRVSETYARDSAATNKNALSDVYVKAFRWASDRIGDEGIVAFITNNGFLDGVAFDGMRRHLAQDFSTIYHIDLKGNARTSGERRRREAGNVFDDTIRVGVGITFLIKKKSHKVQTDIYVYSIDDYLRSKDKKAFLEKAEYYRNVALVKIAPDANYTWLTEGMHDEFETFLPMGTKETRLSKTEDVQTVFKDYGRGVGTSRDAWAYNFDEHLLAKNMETTIEFYNEQVGRWLSWLNTKENSGFYKLKLNEQKRIIDDFVIYNDEKLNWTRDLKKHFRNKRMAEFSKKLF